MCEVTEQEQAFWVWWAKIEPYKNLYNLRMAFECGYHAAKEKAEVNGQ